MIIIRSRHYQGNYRIITATGTSSLVYIYTQVYIYTYVCIYI